MIFGGYTLIQYRNRCLPAIIHAGCYQVHDPTDLAVIAAAAMGACFGFLWCNAAPAHLFMGDTGSLALGGLIAAIAILSHTELLLVVVPGLYAVIALSGVLQVGWFKLTRSRTGSGRRALRMSPLHHHFEMSGWNEITIIIRFWIIAGVSVAFVGLFYTEFIGYGHK